MWTFEEIMLRGMAVVLAYSAGFLHRAKIAKAKEREMSERLRDLGVKLYEQGRS